MHRTKDEEDNQDLGTGKNEGIVSRKMVLKTIKDGMGYSPKIDDFAQQVCGDGIHAIDFEKVKEDMPMEDVVNVIEKSHKQKAKAAAEQYHRGGPQGLDDGEIVAPQPSQQDESGAKDEIKGQTG